MRARYDQAAREHEEALCWRVEYDPRYLEAIPGKILERDYGCGDPSYYALPLVVRRHLAAGCAAGLGALNLCHLPVEPTGVGQILAGTRCPLA